MFGTHQERIIELLEAASSGFCDDCLAVRANISPRQTVNRICLSLQQSGHLLRERSSCEGCGRHKKLNRLSVGARVVAEDPGLVQGFVDADWFDKRRRELVRLLNQMDPSGKGESFSQRVTRLRNEGRLAGNVVSLMLTFTSFRNLVCFENYSVPPGEERILRLVDAELREWIEAQK